jgi:hypothetical protein
MATKHFTVENDDGDEIQVELPVHFEVCPRCEGEGTHLHESIGQHAYTVEEFNEEFDDEERAEYFKRGGRYDVVCSECGGQRVISVVDEEKCVTDEQKEALESLASRSRAMAELEADERSESILCGDLS